MGDVLDIHALAQKLFSSNDGNISISIQTISENGSAGATNIYDMDELFMNLILLGLQELDIDLQMSALDDIIEKMRPYFARMRVAMHIDKYAIEDHDPVVQNRYTTLVPDFSTEDGISFKMAMNMSHQRVQQLSNVATVYYDGGTAFVLRFSLA